MPRTPKKPAETAVPKLAAVTLTVKKSPRRKPAAPKSGFDPPQESNWHHMISEAAYYLAQKRGFAGDRRLDDWLTAEEHIRQIISVPASVPAKMNV